ncbi:MAG: helix-turn-helix domain-containing protein [Planctomycetota bacterium]|nr:MAG: helix-turn-helix domain-containing protein [Planctomycetota bacterium]
MRDNDTTTTPMLIGRDEACRVLGIGRRKLWELTNRGVIPHVRIDRAIRYSPDSLRRWIAAQEQGGARR